jgi:hypothetical protein
VSKKTPSPRVQSIDPLASLIRLLCQAEEIADELYALPCCRTAMDVPCRAAIGSTPQEGESCGERMAKEWCSTCLAWWRACRIADHLTQCVRIERGLASQRIPKEHPPQCDCGRCIDLSAKVIEQGPTRLD